MANTGAWPVNAATPEGMFRFQVGDVVGTPNEDSDPATAEFEFMSDATITELLAANAEDVDLAKSIALQSMATQLITQAQDIQVDDIRIKTVERAKLFLELSNNFGLAAAGRAAADGFQVVSMTDLPGYPTPQGQPVYLGDRYDSGF